MGFIWCVYIPVLPGLKSYKTVIINITTLSHLQTTITSHRTSAIQALLKDLEEQGSCAESGHLVLQVRHAGVHQ